MSRAPNYIAHLLGIPIRVWRGEIAIEGDRRCQRRERPSSSRVYEMNCSTCGQRIPEPRPLRDASPSDFLAARAVRAVLNELVGQEVLRSRVAELVADRLEEKLSYKASVALEKAERAVAYVLD